MARIALLSITLSLGMSLGATADTIAHRQCTTVNGTRTCTTIIVHTSTDMIMGMPASAYARGVKEGKCMPSPSGACGGG